MAMYRKQSYSQLTTKPLFCYTRQHMNLSQILGYSTEYQTFILGAAIFFLFVYTLYLHRKLSYFMRGENGRSLESTLHAYIEQVDSLKKHDELIAEHALKLDTRLAQAVRNVSTVRFKAFDQNSSNQSFAIALVNELGDGVILSSLHHRERVSVFAKPVAKYECAQDLTEEEEKVLLEAKTSHRS